MHTLLHMHPTEGVIQARTMALNSLCVHAYVAPSSFDTCPVEFAY